MPAIYNQLNLGSCVFNSIAAITEYEMVKQGEPDFMPSRLFMYYNTRVMEGTVGFDSGAEIRDGMKSLATQGVCPESEWPYNVDQFTVQPPQQDYTDALSHLAVQYSTVDQSLSQIQGCLANGYPIVFGFTVFESFESSRVANTGIMPMPSAGEGIVGGHAVVAVGYDDTHQTIKVRNSWGPDWGDSGSFHMPYAYILDSNLCDDFWQLTLLK